VSGDPDAGLLPDFDALAGGGFDPEKVHPEVKRFYERTARYGLDVTPEWRGLLRYPPRTLIYLVSRTIKQLNLPTGSSRADAGMTSELFRLSDPATGKEPYACWLRRSKITGEVGYAGFYTPCKLPGREGRFVKVVFPLYPPARRPCSCARGTVGTVPWPSSPTAAASARRATTASTRRRKVRYACGASRWRKPYTFT